MNLNTQKDDLLRRYLLGKLDSETERDSVETKYMTDEDFFREFEMQEEMLIEDYAAGNLNETDGKLFEENFLISDERREELRLVQDLQRYAVENKFEEDEKEHKSLKTKINSKFFGKPFSTSLITAAAFAVLLVAIFVAWKIYFQPDSDKDTLIALNKAYQKERPFESRISGFDYAPANNLRGAEKKNTDEIERDRAQSLSLEAVNKAKTANSLHSLGKVYLAEKEFDKAADQLKNALELAPQDAEILNDLGTAYLEKGKTLSTDENGKSIELFAKSLEEFEKALAVKPDLQAAQFNKAICLQILKQPHQAQEAWENYLKLDDRSPWAEEARQNLQRLQLKSSQTKTKDEILHDFMDAFERSDHEKAWQILSRNREMITGKLIPQQLAGLFLTAKDDSKNKYLNALKYAGKLEKENSGDPYFAEISDFYSHLSSEKQTALQSASDSIYKGYKLCLKNNYQDALAEFTDARRNFEKAGDEWEMRLADYWIGYSDFQLTNVLKSRTRLEELAKFCETKKYKWLESNTFSKLANNSVASKEYSRAIEYNQKALNLSKETSDLYLKEKSFSQLAEQYQILGQHREVLNYVQQSLQLLDYPETSDRQKWRIYAPAIKSLFAQKYYKTAANLIEESINLNKNDNSDVTFSYTNYVQLSRIYGILGDYEQAFKFADLSVAAAESLTDEKHRNKAKALTISNIAMLQRQKGDCPAAIKSDTEAIKFSDSTEFSLYDYKAYENRLACYVKLGDNESVEAELPKVLDLFESNRTKILEEQSRNAFFDSENDIYDLAVNYEFDRKNYEKAFDYSEKSRSRSLLDLQKNGVNIVFEESKPKIVFNEKIAEPRRLKEIQSALPENVQIVEYSLLPRKIVIWLVTKNDLKPFSTDISNEAIKQKVSLFSEAIQNKESDKVKSLGQELYENLFAPFEKDINNEKEVCLIPDKALFTLPFAALISGKTNNYLFADYRILVSPSANVFLTSTEKARERNSRAEEKLLSVGNPIFDHQEFPNLPELPAAEDEAREVAALYKSPTLLLENEATGNKIKADIAQADVVHFAGHYITSEESPLLSGLLVAGIKDDSKLTNYELLEGKIQKPKLIVLSACQSGVENYYKGEGMIGAGRIFLASGIPLIVGSQWEVDSDATEKLMQKFHYYRKRENLPTVAALQQAQLEMLNGPNEEFRQPFYWSGFLAIGGDAEF